MEGEREGGKKEGKREIERLRAHNITTHLV